MAKKKVFSIGNYLSDSLEETIATAHNYAGELRIDVIPIKKIEVDPENPRDLAITFTDLYNGIAEDDPDRIRKTNELDSLQSISNSIKEQGIINPIIVYKHGDVYRLVAGERRTLASILANKPDIQAKILDGKPTELKIRILQWIENIERSDLSLWERLKNLEKIVSAFAESKGISVSDVSVTDLSNLVGCAKSHAINLKALLNADEELKQLIRENKIKNLEKAAFIATIQSQELKNKAIAECISGATYKQLKSMSEQSIQRLVEKRGRQTISVNLGATKNIRVAKVILDSILSNSSLSYLEPHFKNVDLSSHRSIADVFKNLIKKLEEIHA
ncbi:MAG: ParB/RepB/Spo0J family partition protein [Gammaproteobacteria bacterium]|nr:MAG: ParB/RepB/Spo0J family partition protein [Gammaproteobacteria bacterium]